MNISGQNCNLNENAKRHFYRAIGFAEAASKEEDYQAAVDEYDKALEYAPNCPDIYYNKAVCHEMLCKINTRNCDIAIDCYKKYLQLNPNAADKSEVEGRMYAIEAKKELYEKQKIENEIIKQKFVGTWKLTEFWLNGKFSSSVSDGDIRIISIDANGNMIVDGVLSGTRQHWYGEIRNQDLYFKYYDGSVGEITLLSDNKIGMRLRGQIYNVYRRQ